MIFFFTGVVVVESSESSFLPASGTVLRLAATLLVVFLNLAILNLVEKHLVNNIIPQHNNQLFNLRLHIDGSSGDLYNVYINAATPVCSL